MLATKKSRALVDHRGQPLSRERRRVASPYVGRPRLALPGLAPLPFLAFPVTPGSLSYTTPGSYTFVVPNYNSLFVDVYGGGGGGTGGGTSIGVIWVPCGPGTYNGNNGFPGGPGGQSSFNGALFGNGGDTGQFPFFTTDGNDGCGQPINELIWDGSAGAVGGASGGDGNTPGGAANGGASWKNPDYGIPQSIDHFKSFGWAGGDGGAGGRAFKTYLLATGPAPGSAISIVVGGGGFAGTPGIFQRDHNGAFCNGGGSGVVNVSWS